GEIAGGVVLEERLANQEASGKSIEHFARWLCAGVRSGESLRGLDDFGIGSVAAAGGECAEQSIGCGAARMQRLRHRPESRLEAGSLRARKPQCAQPSILVEAQQMRACGRGAESSNGAGGVKS